MVMIRYDLLESAQAPANSDGRAVATLAPYRAGERWIVTRVTVQSTSSQLTPTCKIYRGAEQPNRLIDGTHTGVLDHSDTNLKLHNGEHLVAVWEGADVGSQCTITIEGESAR